jgi:predicted DNA-binding transcriptional regulator YafY/tRNA A-37 threonylcarbamoyl transferase component Bud32
MRTICPNCRYTVERPGVGSSEEVVCPACGATYRLDSGGTETWSPDDRRRPAIAPRPGRLQVGQTIAHYVILEALGVGGMGVVYKARDTRLGRQAALKFLPSELARDPQRLERFRREARTATALNHPHICTVHDIGDHDGQPYLVMELIEGRTLRELVEQRPSPRELMQLGGQIARALAAAHAAGIVHRDIKPENIMVRADGYAKVVDFGLALLVSTDLARDDADDDRFSESGTLVGTIRYMSPEQARGEAVGSPSDIFSLGICLYELATGRHPFESDSRIGALRAIRSDTPPPPRGFNLEVPEALEALIQRMLDKDPRQRPAAQEVADALLAGVPMTEGELVALLLAERVLQQYQGTPYAPDLARAFAKITAGLTDLVTVDLRHLEGLHSFRTTAPSPFEPEIFRDLLAAATHHRRVLMDYWTASRDEQTRRAFDPYHLASVDGQWYAIGYCHLRQEVRIFSPGRIRSLELTGETFVVPATFDIGAYLRQSFGIMHGREGEVNHVRLRFRGDAVRYVRERTWHASQALETTAEGDLIVTLEVSHLREVERWALSWAPDCEVLEPPELREQVADALARGAERHTRLGEAPRGLDAQ